MNQLLAGLNKAQRDAVSSDAAILQVLAPPGSGKTKTLTARVAHLITRGLKPWNIIVCTFTVKAAKEMQERLTLLVGEEVKKKLKIGTFHGIALRYLRQFRQEAGLKDDFGVADSNDTLAIVKRVIKAFDCNMEPKQARGRISSLKSKGIDCDTYAAQGKNKSAEHEFISIYREYQAALDKGNYLDYDDILLRSVALLRAHPQCVSHVEAVLVDEFQDTNNVQYDLMALFAQRRHFITIVGDPDQSIYGWRSAEIKNLGRMKERWPDTLTINLEENYRSSGAILHAAQEVIEQDDNRPPKKLQATHSYGHKPVLRKLPTSRNEAAWIVSEIKRIHALTGKLFEYDDFAILLRSARLSRTIEQEFGKEGIPYRMIGGLRFYDRKEVQIILDYLRVINSPSQGEALERVLNVPPRHVGDATIEKLQAQAKEKNATLWEIVVATSRGEKNKLHVATETGKGLAQFIDIILTGQRKLESDAQLVDLVNYLIKKVGLEAYLKKKYTEDFENRWANVEELIAQAADKLETVQPIVDDGDNIPVETPLSQFLANVALAASADEKSEEDSAQGHVVTISTIHAAKGLEWPVVLIPACYEGSIPHSRAEDTDEERRLLYVGMTRAQALLYLSCPLKDSEKNETSLSNFLSVSGLNRFFDEHGPALRYADATTLAKVLHREAPSAKDIVISSAKLEKDEDDYWPVNGEYPLGYSEEWAASTIMDGVAVFGNSRSASWVKGNGEGSEFPAGFVSAASRYGELLEQQEQIAQKRIDKKLEAAAKTNQPRGRKRQIEGQGSLASFFGKKTTQPPALRQSTSQPEALRDITNIKTEDTGGDEPALELPRFQRGIRSTPLFKRAKTMVQPETSSSHQPYVCFSSSPRKVEGDSGEQVETEMSKPVPAPHFQRASSLHTTSMDSMTVGRKTLGVKRSLNGWNWSGRKQ